MIPVTPCPKPAAAGCSLQKSTGLFALPLATPSRGWHVTYITTPVLFIPGLNHFQSRSQCKRLSGKMPLGERFSAQRQKFQPVERFFGSGSTFFRSTSWLR